MGPADHRHSGVISTKPGLTKFLKTTPGGLLPIDTARIKAEQRRDGKFLLRCADAPRSGPAPISAAHHTQPPTR
jgi:hypothetical protein